MSKIIHREEWYTFLPPDLLQGVHKYDNEWVWCREQALPIMDWLNANGHVVTDIETWMPTLPGPTPLINNWNQNRAYPSPPFPMLARNFIATFTPDSSEQITGFAVAFNISAMKSKP